MQHTGAGLQASLCRFWESVDHPSGEVRPGKERVKLCREHSCCPKWELVGWPAVGNQVIPASWERRGPVQRVRTAGRLRQKLPLGRAEERQQELGNIFFYQTLTVCGLSLTFFCLNPACSRWGSVQLSASVGWNLSPGSAGPWGSGFPARGSMALLTCLLPLRLGSQHSLPDLPLWKGEAEAQLGAGGNRAPSRASTVGTRAFSVHGHFVVFGLVSSCWHAFLRNNSVSNCFLYNTESCPPWNSVSALHTINTNNSC